MYCYDCVFSVVKNCHIHGIHMSLLHNIIMMTYTKLISIYVALCTQVYVHGCMKLTKIMIASAH